MRALVASCLLLLSACDLDYGGTRGTLNGDLTGSSPTGAPDGVALVFNHFGTDKPFVTILEGELRGTRFAFDLRGPPPETAISESVRFDGTTSRYALGVVIAYRDLNGNGRLDTIPLDGQPIDDIVGTSATWSPTSESDDSESFYVQYIEGGLPERPAGLQQGYNLLRDNNELVPMNTAVPVPLADRAHDNLYVCESYPQGNMDLWNSCLGSGPVRVYASLERWAEDESAFVQVFSGEGEEYSVEVRVNGVALPYDSGARAYSVQGGSGTYLTANAENTVQVLRDGNPIATHSIWLDPPVEITSPAEGATQRWTEDFPVTWTGGGGYSQVRQQVTFPEGRRARTAHFNTSTTTSTTAHTFPALTSAPAANLASHFWVLSYRFQADGTGNEIIAFTSDQRNLTITP